MAKTYTIPARKLMADATLVVEVTGMRTATWRVRCALPFMWIGIAFGRLAALIAGTGFEVRR